MKKILLTTVVCVGLGLAASAQEKASAGKTKKNATAASKVAKTDPKDGLAERTAAKQAYLNQNKAASSATAPAKAALTRD